MGQFEPPFESSRLAISVSNQTRSATPAAVAGVCVVGLPCRLVSVWWGVLRELGLIITIHGRGMFVIDRKAQ